MITISKLILIGVMQLGLIACATVPSTDELQQLDGEEVRSALVGNTFTYRTDYGRWAEYYSSSDTGFGKASGSWGSQSVTGKYSISEDGEWCATYSGEHDWSTPDHEYCGVIYTDEDGNYYRERTKDTYKPKTIGEIKGVEIKTGDAYGLSE